MLYFHSSGYIFNCKHSKGNNQNIMLCKILGIIPNDSTIRLVGGSSYSEGRVEVLYNGVWGTICSDGWNNNNVEVVCRTLGFSGASTFFSQYGRGSGPIWLNNVMCNGNEASLVECTYPGVGIIEDCTHDKDVGVRCNGFQSKTFCAGWNV